MNKEIILKNKKISIIVISLILLSFFGGLFLGKKSSAGDSSLQKQNSFMGQRGAPSFAGQKGSTGSMVQGEVLSLEGSTITIKERAAGSKIIIVSSSTKVLKTVEGDYSDLKQGDTVVITGTQNTGGSVTATSLMIRDKDSFPKK